MIQPLQRIPMHFPRILRSIFRCNANKVTSIDARLPYRPTVFFEQGALRMDLSMICRLPVVSSLANTVSSIAFRHCQQSSSIVPCPVNLRVEKYLTNSVLIAWNPPSSNIPVLGYQILLDHSLYTTIRATERTRALIENINVNEKIHRISIRTIIQRGLSRDQECTLLLTMSGSNGNSNEVSFAPSELRVDRINQTSAVVSWWPASNEIVHKLVVNDIEVQTLKAGVYRFKLSGLLPNTLHKVTIKAKPPNMINPQQQLAASIEFRTTSFGNSF